MRVRYLGILLLALASGGGYAAAAGPAACMRASGNADARCLERFDDVVARCRAHGDPACEAAARADGGPLSLALGRPERPSRAACSDSASEALDYTSADDVVQRGSEACADFGEDWLAGVFADNPSSLSGAFLDCQREVSRQLGHLRDATVRLEGPRCFLAAYQGDACDRAHRDRRIAHIEAGVRRRILGRCGLAFDALGLGSLDDVIERVFTRARHFAQLVYPPNDLGPTADVGPYPVGVKTLTLFGPARPDVTGSGARPVTVEVYYPSTGAAIAGVPRDLVTVLGVPILRTPSYRDVAIAPGPFPLVLFSHGNDGIRIQSFFFAAHLASHGYVVASPDHRGNTFVDTLLGIVDPNVAANRPLDISFVLDQFLAFDSEPGNFFAGAVDPARVGASGHSFGGYTAFALAGGAGPAGTFTDPRVKAIMPQAPAAPFSDAFFAGIHVPTLLVGGSLDETTPFEENQEHPFEELPSGAEIVALAELTDAGHFTFSDFCEVPRDLLAFLGGFDEACEPRHLPWRRAHDIVKYLALNFFDAVLNDDPAALARLGSQATGGIEDLRLWRK
jgi:predicted dienelactone hydrolase